MNLEHEKTITLPKGGDLEIEFSPAFIEIVKRHFGLVGHPTDDHIRMFVHGAVSSALKNVQLEDM